jgi:hypothetical protein
MMGPLPGDDDIPAPQPVPLEENQALFKAAARLVSSAWERPITVTAAERLTGPGGSSLLFRCYTAAEGQPPASFILKQAAGSLASAADRATWEARRFCNDWLGAEFLTTLPTEVPLGPRFFGGDVLAGCFALEDLGEHRSLVQPLLHGDAADGEAGLLKYFTSLGQLHALTAGQAPAYNAQFSARFPGQQPYAEELDEWEDRLVIVQRHLDQLGVRAPSTLLSEFAAVTNAVTQPGPFLAYIHCDPCPDNLFDQGDRYRFIDFEWGHFGHALLDGVYPRMLWPSCWCANRLPAATLAALELRYRAELSRGCVEAQDDAIWEPALAHMCAVTLLNRLAWDLERGLTDDRKRGLATIRQRTLAQLETLVLTCEMTGAMPVLRGVAEQLFGLLEARWAGTPALPLYPAFATPSPSAPA